jgi:hypothetical protein
MHKISNIVLVHQHLIVQIAITICAGVIALIHVAWPTLTIDAATVTLIVVAIAPWLAPVFKRFKVAGLEVEYQELRSDVRAIQVALKGIVTKYEHEYLKRLAQPQTFPSEVGDDEYHYSEDKHHYSKDVNDRLKKLDDIGFILPREIDGKRDLLRIDKHHGGDLREDVEKRPRFKLSEYVEITKPGRNYLALTERKYLEEN